jgi:hypothetical protein
MRYFARLQPNVAAGSSTREESEPPESSHLDMPATSESYMVEQLIGNPTAHYTAGWD